MSIYHMIKNYPLTVRRIEHYLGDYYLVVFDRPPGLIWLPGSYARFALPNPPSAKEKERALTLATTVDEQKVAVLLKGGPESSGYKQTISNLEQGAKMTLRYPYANIKLDYSKTAHIFFSCGVGIATTRPLVKSLLGSDHQLFVGQLSQGCDVFHEEMMQWYQEESCLNYMKFDEEKGAQNYLDKLVSQYENEAIYYLSGPTNQIKAWFKYLKSKGISRQQIKKEIYKGLL